MHAVVYVVIDGANVEGLFGAAFLERAVATISPKTQVGGCKKPLWKTSRPQCRWPKPTINRRVG